MAVSHSLDDWGPFGNWKLHVILWWFEEFFCPFRIVFLFADPRLTTNTSLSRSDPWLITFCIGPSIRLDDEDVLKKNGWSKKTMIFLFGSDFLRFRSNF